MDFPSDMGKRVMQVNAIPEFDEVKQTRIRIWSYRTISPNAR